MFGLILPIHGMKSRVNHGLVSVWLELAHVLDVSSLSLLIPVTARVFLF